MNFEECLSDSRQTLAALTTIRPQIDAAAALIAETLRRGGKILAAGNGGSAAEASHFATELAGRYGRDRRALPAVALGGDASLFSCVGNDYGFDETFARPLAALGRKGDLLVVFTSSGNSRNILAALDRAKDLGIARLAFLGRGGGAAKGRAEVELIVPGDRGASAQEAHLFLIHYFCELIDDEYCA